MDTDIAVIGLGARFPDAWGPEEFFRNIDAGVVSLREFTDDELRESAVEERLIRSPHYVRRGVRLPGIQQFAAQFFDIPPAEAEIIDPFQRVFLEVCWEALESAGHPSTPTGPLTGVYAGASFSTYAMALYLDLVRRRGYSAITDGDVRRGSLFDFMPARVAHRLGLRGPAIGVQTACSSSLTAVHQAINGLLAGDCEIALAGGAGGVVPESGYLHEPGDIGSVDGYCRPFDARSTGTVGGSGVGVVVLRRLADAIDDGDHIWAVINGSAVNNDGADRSGFTAPSPRGVAEVVTGALRAADADPDDLCYVEAHGSGTPLGDHIELLGLTEALVSRAGRTGYCGLGSVKANIGHAGSAAGIAGLLKAVHIAGTGTLPPQPQFDRPRDPGVLAGSVLRIDTVTGSCPAPGRKVLVHSMGQGGTNVAVVVSPPPDGRPEPDRVDGPVRLLLSARTRAELDEISGRLADVLDAGTHAAADVAHTLRVGRRHFREHRRVVTADDDRLAGALRMPRPPLVHTAQPQNRTALVVRVAGDEATTEAEATLVRALGHHVRTERQVPVDAGDTCFVLVLGDADPGPSGHRVTPTAAGLQEALSAAWLAGVEVDWTALVSAKDRRVPLPTYPLPRRRYWALDRLGDVLRSAPPTAPVDAPEVAAAAGSRHARPESMLPPTAAEDAVERDVVAIWTELFGIDPIGVDDEFDLLGGTSLLATRMALEVGRRHGVHLNLHRVGGTRATVRRISEVLRAQRRGATGAEGPALDGDATLIDADLELSLGPLAPARTAPGQAVLLTGATGFIGAFLLRELTATGRRVFCLVRGDEGTAWARLCAAATRYRLPAPDPGQVVVVPGDVADPASWGDRGDLAAEVGQILHCAADVIFTEPYRTLRRSNVLGTVHLLRWARAHGVTDFGYVSSLAAATPVGAQRLVVEQREQPLSPDSGGYGSGKWVSERLLDRAERDGMRVRVFRPGLVLGDSTSGACNAKDMTWRVLAGALATGVHPADDRPMFAAPVDVVAAAVVALMRRDSAVGRAFHLVYPQPTSLRGLFTALADAGLDTRGLPVGDWFTLVADRALETGDQVLSALALIRIDDQAGPVRLEARLWQDWLAGRGIEPRITGAELAASAGYLAGQPGYQALLGPYAGVER